MSNCRDRRKFESQRVETFSTFDAGKLTGRLYYLAYTSDKK